MTAAAEHLTSVTLELGLKGLLDDATSRGARVLVGGTVSVADSLVAPTLLGDIPDEAKINSEEIFGPLLPIYAFAHLDEVLQRINAAPKPLALYVLSRTKPNIERVIQETSSGGACVNHSIV